MLEDETTVEQNRMQLQTDINEVETTIDLAKGKLAVFDEAAAAVAARAEKAAAEKAAAEKPAADANATSSLPASSNSDATASSQLSSKPDGEDEADETDASLQPNPAVADASLQPNPDKVADLPKDPADLPEDPADLPEDPADLPEDMPPKPAAEASKASGGGRYKSRRKGKKTNKN
jgi:hypothetical protein